MANLNITPDKEEIQKAIKDALNDFEKAEKSTEQRRAVGELDALLFFCTAVDGIASRLVTAYDLWFDEDE